MALDRPKIGLVLGGGGAKGFAHIPVLKCLDDLEIPIDYIAGTSAGGIIAALYAVGYSGRDIEKISMDIDWLDVFSDRPSRPLLPFAEKDSDGRYQLEFFFVGGIPKPPRGMIFGQKFTQLFFQLTFPLPGDIDFDELPIPFRCVAVDLLTGRQVVLSRGSLTKAMRATMAIPTIFSPVDWENYLLIDGGILNNLPVDVVKEMGADIVIAVDLGSPLLEKTELTSADRVLAQALRIVETEQKKGNRSLADILIAPDMSGLGAMDYFFPEKLAHIVERGEEAARQSLPALLSLKEKYRLGRSTEKKRALTRGDVPPLRPEKKFVLERVTIEGNQKLPTAFIARSLGLRRGQLINEQILNRRTMEVYALGFFESIQPSIFSLDSERLELNLQVREVPRGKLRLGLGFDNFKKLVVAGQLGLHNLFLPGLQSHSQLDIVGLTRFRTRLSFSPPSPDSALSPFVEIHYQGIPTRLYDGEGELLATYKRRSWKARTGLAFHLGRKVNLEIFYALENMDIEEIKTTPYPDLASRRQDRLRGFGLTAAVDTLDAVWTPKNGLCLRAEYEGSYDFAGTSLPYERFEAGLDIYRTFLDCHTFRLYGFLGISGEGLPFFKFFNQGHPRTFVGMGYDQLMGNELKLLRLEYRYKINNFVYAKSAVNLAFDLKQQWSHRVFTPGLLWGAGAGLHISTPAGPLDVIYALGSKSLLQPEAAQGVLYLVLGARF